MTDIGMQLYEDRKILGYIGIVLLMLTAVFYFDAVSAKKQADSIHVGTWQSHQHFRYAEEDDGDIEGDGSDSDTLIG